MKKAILLSLAALLVLAGCRRETTSPDIRTFGMTGPVRDVTHSLIALYNSEDEDPDDPMLEDNEPYLAFDARGRVTLDNFYNTYEYDAQGNLTGEYADYTDVVRDGNGRLVSFDNTRLPEEDFENFDIMRYCNLSFEYDAQGRPVTIHYSGWEWGATYTMTYEGSNVWPATEVIESYDEGYNEKITIDYDYEKFDTRGNWTKRTVTSTSESWDEGDEDNVETYSSVSEEVRTIRYW